MALKDILAAITAEATAKLEAAQAEHNKAMEAARAASTQRTSEEKEKMAETTAKKKQQLKAKVQSSAQMLMRSAEQAKKSELMDELYKEVLGALSKAPKKQVEEFLTACLKRLPKSGTIQAAKEHQSMLKKLAPKEIKVEDKTIKASGGFMFVSETEAHDFTFEHLVKAYLRPATEIKVAGSLFA